MRAIPNAHQQVPMMFRAQATGRCQLQRIIKGEESDSVRWANEWTSRVKTSTTSATSQLVQARDFQISWRLLTNSGLDDSVILPVIGAQGLPYFPGSSMKGLFRRACNATQAERYCGKPLPNNDWQPGILRFHGAYPIDDNWTHHLVDIVHPQQSWQVKSNNKEGGAFVQISLYKPTLRFKLSSTETLNDEEWGTVWEIWQTAIAKGIGSRVSAGYGQTPNKSITVLHKATLKGQGQAPKLIDQSGEFRPNMFRASLRGHAVRIFGGLTTEQQAEQLVQDLFGGIQGREGTVGLIGMQFQDFSLEIDSYGKGSYAQPCYEVEGSLTWYLVRPLNDPDHEKALKKLVANLMQFAMLLGGFGKSWRRADHRLFFDEYYDQGYKALIGCHWQWLGDNTLRRNTKVPNTQRVGHVIDQICSAAEEWMTLRGVTPQPQNWAHSWRESWHPQNVKVFGRMADGQNDSIAIRWFHGPYQPAIDKLQSEAAIYKTHLVGRVSQVGRIWHRMYPVTLLKKDPNDPKKRIVKPTPRYLELLIIFPDSSQECCDFLEFLNTNPEGFEQLWGDK
ncbi:MAG: RAMP superfamily CRISPR-associated protein [Cyanobacteria bacterium P01_A01_bin.37]